MTSSLQQFSNSQIIPWNVSRVLVGSVLVIAAILKISAPSAIRSYVANSVDVSPQLIVLVVLIELLLGIQLLANYSPRFGRCFAIWLFFSFLVFQVWTLVSGQKACPCIGAFELSPPLVMSIDIIALLLLVFSKPKQLLAVPNKSSRQRLLFAFSGLPILALLVFANGAPNWARISIAKNELIIVDSITDIGAGKNRSYVDRKISITNISNNNIRLYGCISGCDCVFFPQLPMTLEPQEEFELILRARFRGRPGRFKRQYRILAEHTSPPFVIGFVRGEVTK